MFYKGNMVYKNVNDLAPNYMKDMFTYVRDSPSIGNLNAHSKPILNIYTMVLILYHNHYI